VRLFLGVGTDAEVPELPELAEAGAQLSDSSVTTSVWQPGPDWTGTVGTPVDALAEALADRTQTPDVYVCGPPAMVDAAAETAGSPTRTSSSSGTVRPASEGVRLRAALQPPHRVDLRR
jgi:NAD(P)H-flavin reductase